VVEAASSESPTKTFYAERHLTLRFAVLRGRRDSDEDQDFEHATHHRW
jgi:hypothetical protein